MDDACWIPGNMSCICDSRLRTEDRGSYGGTIEEEEKNLAGLVLTDKEAKLILLLSSAVLAAGVNLMPQPRLAAEKMNENSSEHGPFYTMCNSPNCFTRTPNSTLWVSKLSVPFE